MIDKIRVKLDKGAQIDAPAHEGDAGYDIHTRDYRVVSGFGSAEFDTGVHIEIPRGYVGLLKSKSGLNVKNGITGEGVIDSGYTGSIRVKLYNNSNSSYRFYPGDKLIQLLIVPVITPTLEIAEELGESDRGDDGFGSTGR